MTADNNAEDVRRRLLVAVWLRGDRKTFRKPFAVGKGNKVDGVYGDGVCKEINKTFRAAGRMGH